MSDRRGWVLTRKIARSTLMDRLWEREGPEAALLWTWMLPWIDVAGNVAADPLWVWGNVVPKAGMRGAITPERIVVVFDVVHEIRLAFRYEVDESPYLHVPGFRDSPAQKGLRKGTLNPEYPPPPRGMKTKWLRYQMDESPQTEAFPVAKATTTALQVPLPKILSGEFMPEPAWLSGHPVKNEVIGWWVEALRMLGHVRPPGPAIHRMGRVAERVGESYSREEIVRAIVGIGTTFPWCPKTVDPKSPHRAWDLMTLEKHFATLAVAKLPSEERADFRRKFTQG